MHGASPASYDHQNNFSDGLANASTDLCFRSWQLQGSLPKINCSTAVFLSLLLLVKSDVAKFYMYSYAWQYLLHYYVLAKSERLRSVRRVHVGTHSPVLHLQTRSWLKAHGFEVEVDYPPMTFVRTKFGPFLLNDGILAARQKSHRQ